MFLNKVTLVGFLGRDPKVRYLPDGRIAVTLNVATNHRSRTPDGGWVAFTEWHRVKAYGRLAEVAGAYLRKGGQVYVDGRLKTEAWTDRSGKDISWVVVEATQIVMLDRPGVARADGDLPGDADMSWLGTTAPPQGDVGAISAAKVPF